MASAAHVIPATAPLYLSRRAREERLAQAEAEFDAVIGELQSMRRRFVNEGDFESLGILASNLQGETW